MSASKRDSTGSPHVPKIATKGQLIKWINSTLKVVCHRIQSLGTGVVYCQLLNFYAPGTIVEGSIHKNPRSDYDNLHNVKLFANGLTKLKLKKNFDIDKITKCKYQDNWQLCSWLYKQLKQEGLAHIVPAPQTVSHLNNNIYELQTECGSNSYIYSTSHEHPSSNNPHTSTSANHLSVHLNKKRPHFQYTVDKENYTSSLQAASRIQYHVATARLNGASVTPANGKSSVSSELFQNNFVALIDRIKEIVAKSDEDSDIKIRNLKLLLNVRESPAQEQQFDDEIKSYIDDDNLPGQPQKHQPLLSDPHGSEGNLD